MPHFLVRLLLFLGVGTALYEASPRHASELVPLAMLVVGVAGARHFAGDLVDFIPAIKRAAEESAVGKLGGRFYTFDGAQIRLCLVDDVVWIVERDVRGFMAPPVTAREQRLLGAGYARIPGMGEFGYSESGLQRLIELRLRHRGGDAPMRKFAHWLRQEAIPNVKRLPSSAFTIADPRSEQMH